MRAFKLAEPEMRLDIINGKISNFNNRMNNSPGYAINIIALSLKLYDRKLKPVDMEKQRKQRYKINQLIISKIKCDFNIRVKHSGG